MKIIRPAGLKTVLSLGAIQDLSSKLFPRRQEKLTPFGRFNVEVINPQGLIIASFGFPNLVTNVGKNRILDCIDGTVAGATVYVGLTDGTPTTAAGDTMASHAGWSEVTTYSESTRQTWSGAAASSQSRTNSASKASFSINGTVTVGGLFIATSSTKGETASVLISVGAFSEGDFSLNSGSTLNCTWALSL